MWINGLKVIAHCYNKSLPVCRCVIMIPILIVIESWNLCFRYAGVPVDFEELEINGSTTDEETLRSALLSVQRNGIALKGTCIQNLDQSVLRFLYSRHHYLDEFKAIFRRVIHFSLLQYTCINILVYHLSCCIWSN